MKLVDSSGWLEYFADTVRAEEFASAIEEPERLVVPTISIYEVFRQVLRQRDEDAALQAIALMHQGHVVELNSELSLHAAKLGLEHGLPMADSIILATAVAYSALLITQDADFKGIKGVKYIRK